MTDRLDADSEADDHSVIDPATPATADPSLLSVPECAPAVAVALALGIATAAASWVALRWRRDRRKKQARGMRDRP